MGAKTNIKDVPVANERLLYETSLETREDKDKVKDVIKHIGTFIADTMGAGLMEAVMIPEFGKFKPKQDMLKGKYIVEGNRRSGMDLLYRAVTGKKLIDKREKTDDNETI